MPCRNAALCIDGVDSYVCDCVSTASTHYEGPLCEYEFWAADVLVGLVALCTVPCAALCYRCRIGFRRIGWCIAGEYTPPASKYFAEEEPKKDDLEEEFMNEAHDDDDGDDGGSKAEEQKQLVVKEQRVPEDKVLGGPSLGGLTNGLSEAAKQLGDTDRPTAVYKVGKSGFGGRPAVGNKVRAMLAWGAPKVAPR